MDRCLKVKRLMHSPRPSFVNGAETRAEPYRQARAERSAIESLVFTLKEGFEFGEMVRRTHENVLAEMLEKVLAYNVSQNHPSAKKAFRARTDGAGSGLVKINYCQSAV
jgi:hypothetical protein